MYYKTVNMCSITDYIWTLIRIMSPLGGHIRVVIYYHMHTVCQTRVSNVSSGGLWIVPDRAFVHTSTNATTVLSRNV